MCTVCVYCKAEGRQLLHSYSLQQGRDVSAACLSEYVLKLKRHFSSRRRRSSTFVKNPIENEANKKKKKRNIKELKKKKAKNVGPCVADRQTE